MIHTSEQITTDDYEESSKYSEIANKYFNMAEINHAFDEEIPVSPSRATETDKKFNMFSRLL